MAVSYWDHDSPSWPPPQAKTGCSPPPARFCRPYWIAPVNPPKSTAVKAISEGHSKFCRIVIAGNSKDFCYPCGACRQFLYEFSPDMEVICLNRAREAKRMTLRELMPCGFDSTFL